MSDIRMRHVMDLNESFHILECVMSQIYLWVMSHIKMRYVTDLNAELNADLNESCHMLECVMSQI